MKLSDLIQINEDAVDSSWLADVTFVDMKYENGNVTFATLSGYRYTAHNIPKRVFDAWVSSDSKGKFFHKVIKNKYVIT